jgi:hypothetical protein
MLNEKKIFAIIIDNERLSFFSKNIKFFLGNIKKYVPVGVETYLIDISNLHIIKKPKVDINEENLEFKYFTPKNFKELYNFSKKNEIICMHRITEIISNLRLNILINIICSKRFIVGVDGFFIIADETKELSYYEKINVFINVKLSYYIYRIASIFKLVSKVDILISASKSNIEGFKKGISQKIKDKIGIDFSYFKKIYRVNSRSSINLSKKDLPEKFIVFCDSGYDHKDCILRDGPRDDTQREKYYQKVYNFFNYLESTLNKKVIFCQHPKTDYPQSENFEKIKRTFHTVKYETEKYIDEAYLVIFLSSVSISYAIALRKKIILINSSYLGTFYQLRHALLEKEISLLKFDIDKEEYKRMDKIRLSNELNKNLNNYDKFIDENVATNNKENHFDQIKEILNKEFFKN